MHFNNRWSERVIAGWRCIYTPQAVVRHHRGSTLGKSSMRRLELIERNRLLLAVKLFPASLLCLNPLFFMTRMATCSTTINSSGILCGFSFSPSCS